MYAPLTDDNDQYSAASTAKEGNHRSFKQWARMPGAAEPEGGRVEGEGMLDLNDPDDDGGWEKVTRSDPDKEHRRHMRHTQPCPERVRCRAKGERGYRHTDEEVGLFRDNPTRDFQV